MPTTWTSCCASSTRWPTAGASAGPASRRWRWRPSPTGPSSGRKASWRARSRRPPGGDNGFGYDPVFVPAPDEGGDGRTFAEMRADEKDALSHRGRAFRSLAAALAEGAPSASGRVPATVCAAASRRSEQLGGEGAVGVEREVVHVRDDLDAHVVRAGIVVGADPVRHRLGITPRDDGVDQPVAPAPVDVVVAETERAQVLGVVGQRQVDAGVRAGQAPAPSPGRSSSTTATSGASSGPGPRISRARAVCSTGRSRDGRRRRVPPASSSMRGPSAARPVAPAAPARPAHRAPSR